MNVRAWILLQLTETKDNVWKHCQGIYFQNVCLQVGLSRYSYCCTQSILENFYCFYSFMAARVIATFFDLLSITQEPKINEQTINKKSIVGRFTFHVSYLRSISSLFLTKEEVKENAEVFNGWLVAGWLYYILFYNRNIPPNICNSGIYTSVVTSWDLFEWKGIIKFNVSFLSFLFSLLWEMS